MLKDLKIKLSNHAQFLEACDAFMKLGYQWGSRVPHTAPYLYSHSDGRILADFFDVEGADLSSPNTAFSYFTNHKNQAVTLEELKIMAYGNSVQMTSEQQIEQEIQDKGLNAPRLTPEHIDATISSVNYFTADDGVVGRSHQNKEVLFNPGVLSTLTFCVIVLKNGFTVTGESACASPENFDAEIGKKIAYDNARNKIWQLEGYLLKQQIHHEAKMKEYFAEQGVNKDAVFIGIDLASVKSLEEQLPTADIVSAVVPDWRASGDICKNASNGELPVPTAVNCGEARGTVGEAKSCLDSVSHLNKNYHNIGLLLEILRTTNVGIDVTDKARAKLSELVNNI